MSIRKLVDDALQCQMEHSGTWEPNRERLIRFLEKHPEIDLYYNDEACCLMMFRRGRF